MLLNAVGRRLHEPDCSHHTKVTTEMDGRMPELADMQTPLLLTLPAVLRANGHICEPYVSATTPTIESLLSSPADAAISSTAQLQNQRFTHPTDCANRLAASATSCMALQCRTLTNMRFAKLPRRNHLP
jgi:hypothetical protein